MNRYRTLFDILGVPAEVTDTEVLKAYAERIADAGGEDQLDWDIKQAFRFLEHVERRDEYRQLLEACANDHPIFVPEENLKAFRQMCQLARVSVWPDPDVADQYVVRLPGQGPPEWHERYEPIPPLTRWQKFLYLLSNVFLFGVFRGKTLGRQIMLGLLYMGVVAAGVYGVKWSVRRVEEYNARALESAIRIGRAEAGEKLEKLRLEDEALRRDFEQLAGVSLDRVADPEAAPYPEIDDALRWHPTVNEAWVDIYNVRLKPADLHTARQTLVDIQERIQSNSFQVADRERLKKLLAWIEAKTQLVRIQESDLEHIRTTLSLDRSANLSKSSERKEP